MGIVHTSDRGIPLVLLGTPTRNTLTVENYVKWYDLFIVNSSGVVSKVPREAYDKVQVVGNDLITVWSDHAINPVAFQALAEYLGVEVDEVAEEVVIGRWVSEGNRYEGRRGA